jgi:hypothetical protein
MRSLAGRLCSFGFRGSGPPWRRYCSWAAGEGCRVVNSCRSPGEAPLTTRPKLREEVRSNDRVLGQVPSTGSTSRQCWHLIPRPVRHSARHFDLGSDETSQRSEQKLPQHRRPEFREVPRSRYWTNLDVSNHCGCISALIKPSCGAIWKGTTHFLAENADPQDYDAPSSLGRFSAIL